MRKESGFVPIWLVVVAALAGIVVVSSSGLLNKSSRPQVQGLELAKGDDSGSGSSGGGDSGGSSGGGSSSSSSSGGDSGGNKSFGSGNSNSTSATSKTQPSKTPEPFEVKKVEVEVNKTKSSTPSEIESENEIENEIEAPENENIGVELTDGALGIESKEASSAASSRKLGKAQNIKLTLKQNGVEQELEIKAEGDHIKLEAKNIGAETQFPLIFNKVTGQLLVTTPNGQRAIRILPAQASNIARNAGIQNQIDKIEIQTSSNTSISEDVVLKLTGRKTGKILGVFDVNQPVETEIGAQSGNVVNINEPFWLRLLSPLIQ